MVNRRDVMMQRKAKDIREAISRQRRNRRLSTLHGTAAMVRKCVPEPHLSFLKAVGVIFESTSHYGNSGRVIPVSIYGKLAAALGVAAIIGLASGGGVAYAAAGGSATLTTAQITARTDPGLAYVVATISYANETSAGTGMVLTSTGEVLTNNHVIEGATSIKVTDVGNGNFYTATVVGYDTSEDIAVLQLQDASGLKTVTLGNSSAVSTGARVVGIGNAFGAAGGTPPAVTGMVTGLGQSIIASDPSSGTSEYLTGLIESSADLKPGDSGGPLVNSQGRVIGMDTAGSWVPRPVGTNATSQAYAIPIDTALSVARQIEAGNSSATVHIGAIAFLGVQVIPAVSAVPGLPGGLGWATSGVTVVQVVPGSAAAAAGLQAGDRITSVAGRGVTSPVDIHEALAACHPGDKISVTWLGTRGQAHTATATLTPGPPA